MLIKWITQHKTFKTRILTFKNVFLCLRIVRMSMHVMLTQGTIQIVQLNEYKHVINRLKGQFIPDEFIIIMVKLMWAY